MYEGYESHVKPMRDERGYLSIQEVNRLIEACDNDRDRLLIIILANTGRRISEALNIKPEDINYEDELILWKIEKRKDITQAWIRAKRSLLLALKIYILKHNIKPFEYIFKSTHYPDRPISRRRADQIIKKVGKKAGLFKVGNSTIHAHILRHSFLIWGARLVKNAGDLRLLQMLAQHSNISMTASYLTFAQTETDELINSYPDFIKLGISEAEIRKQLREPPKNSDDLDITKISDGVSTDVLVKENVKKEEQTVKEELKDTVKT